MITQMVLKIVETPTARYFLILVVIYTKTKVLKVGEVKNLLLWYIAILIESNLLDFYLTMVVFFRNG